MRKIKAAQQRAQVASSILVITAEGDIIDVSEINAIGCCYPLFVPKRAGRGEGRTRRILVM